MVDAVQSADPSAPRGDARNVYKAGLNTTRLLMALGDVVTAWLLLRGAEVALIRLGSELSATNAAFYEGKVASGPVVRPDGPAQARRRSGDRRGH